MTTTNKSSKYRIPLGILIGFLAALAVLPLLGGSARATDATGPLLSDCDGAIQELVIQYIAAADGIVTGPYREFLSQLPADVTVRVLCPNRSAFDELVDQVGPVACTLSPVIVDHPITTWSRDRWLALAPSESGRATTLLSPRGERCAGIWPAREGDGRVGDDLAAALGSELASSRSHLFFDGGDFVADSETAFVTPAVLRRNLQNTVRTREELVADLAAALGRRVVLLDDAPDHHAGMYMMPLGDRRIMVGDPAAARELIAGLTDFDINSLGLPGGADFSDETIAKFDAVAAQCEQAGYQVTRIPVVPGCDGRTYITPLNAILDQRAARRIVYMPVFDGAEPLNDAAATIWNDLGYEARRVNCTTCYPHFGSLRCLVNVLRRQ